MKVTLFSSGPAANESELSAFRHLASRLESTAGDEQWILLTNLAFSVTHQLQSDEIDIVVIGPPGVRVIEVKHWTAQWVDGHPELVAQEADRTTNKARKIGTTLRRIFPGLPHVNGAILLTQEPSKVKRLAGRDVRGVAFYSLNEWKNAVGFDSSIALASQQVKRLGRALEPKSGVAMDGSLRRLAGYVNLELQTPKDERFHRVYRGIHSARQDRVLLHLYDLSASNERNIETKARREYDALHKLQLHGWAPRISILIRTRLGTLARCSSLRLWTLRLPPSMRALPTFHGRRQRGLPLRGALFAPLQSCTRLAQATSRWFIGISLPRPSLSNMTTHQF